MRRLNNNNTDEQNLKLFSGGRISDSITMTQLKVVLEKHANTVYGSDFSSQKFHQDPSI